jgi:hypothetical protein
MIQPQVQVTTKSSDPIRTPPDPNILAILRLYLEKYEVLADKDRDLYRNLIVMLANPIFVVNAVGDPVDWKEIGRQ